MGARDHVDPQRFDVAPSPESHFSWVRTRMSLERTLMSWVRTGSALVGFGFTIVQFFERVGSMPGARAPAFPEAPTYFGLSLVGAGTIALAIAVGEYVSMERYLWSGEFRPIAGIANRPRRTPTLFVAIVLILVGAWAFAGIATRLG